MSKQRPVIPGEVFHKLTVLEQVESHPTSKNRMVRCACACGNEAVKDWSSVWRGKTRSCGCMKADKARANGYASKTHGKRYSREYAIWRGLHTRCYNVSDPGYRNYGALGITVCDRWHKFENFYADMGDRPTPGHSIDRIDVDGPYSPENCRWVTNAEQQQRNKRTNRRVTAFGETLCLAEWGRRYNLRPETISERLAYGWGTEKAVSKPSRKRRVNANPQEKTRTGPQAPQP